MIAISNRTELNQIVDKWYHDFKNNYFFKQLTTFELAQHFYMMYYQFLPFGFLDNIEECKYLLEIIFELQKGK